MPFVCSICGEESTRICVRCTKDACENHLCEKCLRCSDCCECEVVINEPLRESARSALNANAEREAERAAAADAENTEPPEASEDEPEPLIP
ncbi:MAG TPA: hypothetical protein VG675_15680 [Bryobacteraceae bacterium]|nr:hypothetical protein [Bryobacteraceae bacterium]